MTRRICVLYTGGTIGMEAGDNGWRPAASFAALVERQCPGLFDAAVSVREYAPLLDSANAGPDVWYRLGREIRALQADFDGFVVVYGTDTLCYVAASLALQLAGTGVAVAVTGAMVPLVAAGSDGGGNLTLALETARSMGPGGGVAVCFDGRVQHAARCRKVMAHGRAAMRIGADLVGEAVGPSLARPLTPLALLPAVPETAVLPRLGIFSLHPGLNDSEVDGLVHRGLHGLVLECFGSGTGPTADGRLGQVLQALQADGTVVVAISQCLHGDIAFETYEAGAAFAQAGVVAGGGMTREAAFAKLHLLLALGMPPAVVRARLAENWCGER